MDTDHGETCDGSWHDAYLRDCPSRTVLALISDKWATLLVCAMRDRPMRFGELRRRLDGISQKVLTASLRELERAGLVERTVYPTTPPRVEYALTPLGHALDEPLAAVKAWSEAHIGDIEAAQRAYDERALRQVRPLLPA